MNIYYLCIEEISVSSIFDFIRYLLHNPIVLKFKNRAFENSLLAKDKRNSYLAVILDDDRCG